MARVGAASRTIVGGALISPIGTDCISGSADRDAGNAKGLGEATEDQVTVGANVHRGIGLIIQAVREW